MALLALETENWASKSKVWDDVDANPDPTAGAEAGTDTTPATPDADPTTDSEVKVP